MVNFFSPCTNEIINKKNPKELLYSGKNVMLYYANNLKDLSKKDQINTQLKQVILVSKIVKIFLSNRKKK